MALKKIVRYEVLVTEDEQGIFEQMFERLCDATYEQERKPGLRMLHKLDRFCTDCHTFVALAVTGHSEADCRRNQEEQA